MFGVLAATLVHRGTDGTRDRHNNPVLVETGREVLAGCNLQQQSSDELRDERDTIISTWVLFAPPPQTMPDGRALVEVDAATVGVPPDPGDGVTIATFEIEGNPDGLRHIDGELHHLELILRRAEV